MAAIWKRKQTAKASIVAQQAGENSSHSPYSWVQSACNILWGRSALPRCWLEWACVLAWWTINHADLLLCFGISGWVDANALRRGCCSFEQSTRPGWGNIWSCSKGMSLKHEDWTDCDPTLGKEKLPLESRPGGRSPWLLIPLACGSSGSHIYLKERELGLKAINKALNERSRGSFYLILWLLQRNKRQEIISLTPVRSLLQWYGILGGDCFLPGEPWVRFP